MDTLFSISTLILLGALLCAVVSGNVDAQTETPHPDVALMERAKRIAKEILIVDTHLDVPGRLHERAEDISVRTAGGDFDYVRAVEGGLKVAFMAIFVPSDLDGTGKSASRADTLIDIMEGVAAQWPEKFAIVRSVEDVREQADPRKVLFALGVENGGALDGKLENLKHFYDRGVRYITLAHALSNDIADAAYDTTRRWNGLSPFGTELIDAMNRCGMMIDVSHVSDSAFYQVVRLSRAPVIASHSSCRAFTPGFERNMSDDMIRALAAQGGVLQINFGSEFLDPEILKREQQLSRDIKKYLGILQIDREDSVAREFARAYRCDHPSGFATVTDIVRHIDHAVKLVGIDYVGLGSDFDGLGDTLPEGVKDVSGYPALIAELLRWGYTEPEIKKICSENLLRVWSAVERTARELHAGG